MSVFDRAVDIVDQLGVDVDQVVMGALPGGPGGGFPGPVELIMAFEEEFGGEILYDDAQKITTVQEAVSFWERAFLTDDRT